MTNPIPPCPVHRSDVYPDGFGRVQVRCCDRMYEIEAWYKHCWEALGYAALAKYGIHTLAELEARLAPAYVVNDDGVVGTVPVAPDPRVAALDDVRLLTENAIRYAHLAYCRTLEREPEYLAEMKRIVAAQRGEGV